MIIKYFNKKSKKLKTDSIDATLLEYEISENDMFELAKSQSAEYKITRVLLTNNNKKFDLVVDNIKDGRIIQGELREDKYILDQYIVKKGLDELLAILVAKGISPTPSN